VGATTRGYVDASHGQIHYRAAGSGPAVLLLHQAGRTGAIYDRVAHLLAPHYRAIMIDLPGFGESDPLPLPCSVADLAQAALEFLDGLGIDAVRLSGHHMGAVFAGELAASHPERTVAFAPSGYPLYLTAEERKQVPKEAQTPRPITQMGGHSVPVVTELQSDGSHLNRLFQRAVAMLWYSKISLGAATRPVMLPFENLPPEDLEFINDYVVDGLKAIGAAGTLAAVRGYMPEERLALVKAPTLFIQSTGPVEVVYCQRAEALQEFVPGSRVASIENGDFHMTHTRAEELSSILLEFFREVDEKPESQ
jgi:pimeloyl-ACP methyl ester carboxylesterase